MRQAVVLEHDRFFDQLERSVETGLDPPLEPEVLVGVVRHNLAIPVGQVDDGEHASKNTVSRAPGRWILQQ